MPANTAPIFPLKANNDWCTVLAGNTSKDGSSGTITLLFTSNATDGSRVDYIRCVPLGNNVASVARIFLNNGGVTTVAANNSYIKQASLVATTISEVAVSGGASELIITLDQSLDPGHRLYVTIGTTVAAGWAFTACAGDYS